MKLTENNITVGVTIIILIMILLNIYYVNKLQACGGPYTIPQWASIIFKYISYGMLAFFTIYHVLKD